MHYPLPGRRNLGEGHDKPKCKEGIETVQAAHATEAYGLEAYGCGLCQTKVPCESRIPSVKTKDDPHRPYKDTSNQPFSC